MAEHDGPPTDRIVRFRRQQGSTTPVPAEVHLPSSPGHTGQPSIASLGHSPGHFGPRASRPHGLTDPFNEDEGLSAVAARTMDADGKWYNPAVPLRPPITLPQNTVCALHVNAGGCPHESLGLVATADRKPLLSLSSENAPRFSINGCKIQQETPRAGHGDQAIIVQCDQACCSLVINRQSHNGKKHGCVVLVFYCAHDGGTKIAMCICGASNCDACAFVEDHTLGQTLFVSYPARSAALSVRPHLGLLLHKREFVRAWHHKVHFYSHIKRPHFERGFPNGPSMIYPQSQQTAMDFIARKLGLDPTTGQIISNPSMGYLLPEERSTSTCTPDCTTAASGSVQHE